MSIPVHEASAGVFVRGLTNLKTQLARAEDHAAASGIPAMTLLNASLAHDGGVRGAGASPGDLHAYTLAGHVHWAAEAARLAVDHLVGAPRPPAANDATSFADLHRRLDATIAHVQSITPGDLEAGLDREIVIEKPRGSVRANGRQFLIAFAIPHFFYHVATAYGILRNQGVPLTMGDFLGNWGAS